MRSSNFSAILAAASLACCMQATGPGLEARYNVEFVSPSADYVIGKKFHWSRMPVRVKYYPCNVAGCRTTMETAVMKGFDFWKRNASLYGEIQTEMSDTGDVEIMYVNSLGTDVIAQCGSFTTILTSGRSAIKLPLTLKIATTVNGAALEDHKYEFVAAHEMGHCLGLWDHSPRDGDLMNAYLTDKTNYSARDLNSLRWLYSQPTDVDSYPYRAEIADASSFGGEFAVSPPLTLP